MSEIEERESYEEDSSLEDSSLDDDHSSSDDKYLDHGTDDEEEDDDVEIVEETETEEEGESEYEEGETEEEGEYEEGETEEESEELETKKTVVANVSSVNIIKVDKPPEKTIKKVLGGLSQPKPGKDITVQPVKPEQVEAKINKTKLNIQTDKPIKVSSLVAKPKKIKLEDLLIKSPDESQDFYLMRYQYSKIAQSLFPKYPVTTFILLGQMGANRGLYGVKYPEETNLVLDYMDRTIKAL